MSQAGQRTHDDDKKTTTVTVPAGLRELWSGHRERAPVRAGRAPGSPGLWVPPRSAARGNGQRWASGHPLGASRSISKTGKTGKTGGAFGWGHPALRAPDRLEAAAGRWGGPGLTTALPGRGSEAAPGSGSHKRGVGRVGPGLAQQGSRPRVSRETSLPSHSPASTGRPGNTGLVTLTTPLLPSLPSCELLSLPPSLLPAPPNSDTFLHSDDPPPA